MADYGLNAVADAMGRDYYGTGQKSYSDLQSVLANTEATRANTARTEALTPLEAERQRLGNLQGQADEQAGVYGAKAEEGLWSARQKARQAQQAWEQLPEEHKVKMLTLTKEKTTAVLKGALADVMATGDAQAAVRYIEQNLPEATKDKGWQQAVQQFSSMPPEQVIAKLNETLARLGSSDAYADPKQQGTMISEDQKHQNAMELERLRGQNAARTAQSKPPVDNLNQTEYTQQLMNIYQDEAQPPAIREKARQALEYLSKAGAQTKDTILGPQTTTKETALPSALPPKPKSAAYTNWSNTKRVEFLKDMASHPELIDEASKRFGIDAEWIRKQIASGKWNK